MLQCSSYSEQTKCKTGRIEEYNIKRVVSRLDCRANWRAVVSKVLSLHVL
jgi:hypothetical protein